MPAYRVEVLRGAQQDLLRLGPTLHDRAIKVLSSLAEEPRPGGSQKLSGLDAHRIRVADYRIVYRVIDADRLVLVLRIGHRRDVYRRLR